jgi:4'-phosphopantetheinyl transferase
MDDEEKVRAARFIREEDRNRYTLAHGSLRAVLARYVGGEPALLQFRREAGGRPILVENRAFSRPVGFSLAHSGDLVLVAVAPNYHVGVDLEKIRGDIDVMKLAERFYLPAEHRELAQLPAPDRISMFFRLWVAKEAAVKAQGTGLRALRHCAVNVAAGHRTGTVTISAGQPERQDWRIQWLSCGDGWEGAVAYHGTDRLLSVMPEP